MATQRGYRLPVTTLLGLSTREAANGLGLTYPALVKAGTRTGSGPEVEPVG